MICELHKKIQLDKQGVRNFDSLLYMDENFARITVKLVLCDLFYLTILLVRSKASRYL